ncbi:Glycosyltransferase involved in cell wall bisynthesis [Fontimonas thermophila]|uniref:Glycosyltransferase involved in cell wall bisynthesis n=1 Tax=Fontimonas thermophila TaxID=1076937 RepID=A0A1I2J1P3_9GAMM|nr:Glycosyltransferase involved in cell wall bisynthesis [Fontimonas thermophila]
MLNARPSGIARYVTGLLGGLQALRGDDTPLELVQLWRLSRWRRRHLLRTGVGLAQQAWVDGIWPLQRRYDVVHATAHRLPRWDGCAKVVTVHDVYAAVGINYHAPVERERQLARYRELAARADRVICVSENTRRDFLRHFDFDPARTHVIHHGIDTELQPRPPSVLASIRARYAVPDPFLLVFGSRAENKNIPRLLQAYARSGVAADYRLMVAGPMRDADRQRFLEDVAALGLSGRVLVPGYVPDADVPLLYAAASAFLFPSTYEGFGLPILEAMACGTPVLTSTGGACPEVAGGHAVLVDPLCVDDIARGIREVLAMPQARREAALAYAQTKTWIETARQTLAVYRLAIADRGSARRP